MVAAVDWIQIGCSPPASPFQFILPCNANHNDLLIKRTHMPCYSYNNNLSSKAIITTSMNKEQDMIVTAGLSFPSVVSISIHKDHC